jgi:hypothetical protein
MIRLPEHGVGLLGDPDDVGHDTGRDAVALENRALLDVEFEEGRDVTPLRRRKPRGIGACAPHGRREVDPVGILDIEFLAP